jgi:hypothetical protein
MKSALLLCLLALSCGGVAPAESGEADVTATAYLDADEFLNTAGQLDKWEAARARLADDFANICGDTFCGGDFGNLRPLSLRCAVTSKEGRIHGCQYVFAGSYELVDAKTGAISVTAKTFTCRIPATGTIKSLAAALLADGPQTALQRPLPGSTQSVYDALGGCLP